MRSRSPSMWVVFELLVLGEIDAEIAFLRRGPRTDVTDGWRRTMRHLDFKRRVLARGLPVQVARRYETLRGRAVIPVLSEVRLHRCGACGRRLSTRIVEAAWRGELPECRGCERILF
jgi:predicted  nucleic acid-binding Zn-ribbon protein